MNIRYRIELRVRLETHPDCASHDLATELSCEVALSRWPRVKSGFSLSNSELLQAIGIAEGPANPALTYPALIEPIGRCPPEDVGGPPGYEEFLAALADPGHKRHATATVSRP